MKESIERWSTLAGCTAVIAGAAVLMSVGQSRWAAALCGLLLAAMLWYLSRRGALLTERALRRLLPDAVLFPARGHDAGDDLGVKDLTDRLAERAHAWTVSMHYVLSIDDERIAVWRADPPRELVALPLADVLSAEAVHVNGVDPIPALRILWRHGAEKVESDFLLVSRSLPFVRGYSYELAAEAAAQISARLGRTADA